MLFFLGFQILLYPPGWVILMFHPRCPNPLDPGLQQSVLLEPRPPTPQGHIRRFTINTFQFLQDAELRNQEEEVRTFQAIGFCYETCLPKYETIYGTQKDRKERLYLKVKIFTRGWHFSI